ncbi:MAG: RNA methyltransferase [Bacteroidaceae bacterium]|nr:RNA methyltransferase [Bacteroidaceae bacterium]
MLILRHRLAGNEERDAETDSSAGKKNEKSSIFHVHIFKVLAKIQILFVILQPNKKNTFTLETFQLIAKTFQGLEEVLAKELIELGANDIQIGRRMVSFTGDKALMYKANLCLRTAIRILKPILHFKAQDADEIYEKLKTFDWDSYMDANTSFAVDSVVYSDEFRHSKFVAYRVKDAIADYFRERDGKRPFVQVTNPDLLFHIHIAQEDCTLALDSSGESLHKRGYRQETVGAPLNEVLAAGMIMTTGWKGECDLIDPMCGSGTILIEAALIARNIAPGLFRKEFAFEKWKDFNQELFDEIYNDDSNEREFEHHIYGYDKEWKAVNIAKANVRAAGLTKDIDIEHRPFEEFEQPEGKAIIITNPPYGERLVPDDLLELYSTIGTKLKHCFQGNEAWIISYKEECFNKIGLKPSVIIPLYNGALACEFRKYEMFSGRFSEFREGGEKLDKAERPTKERRPLRKRQNIGEAATEGDTGNYNREDFETKEERLEYEKRRSRHDTFMQEQNARARKERAAKRSEREGFRENFRKDDKRRDFKKGAERNDNKKGYAKRKEISAKHFAKGKEGDKGGFRKSKTKE